MILRLLVLSLALLAPARAEMPLQERKSGAEFMGRELRAMQDEEATSPAVFALLEGASLWGRPEGRARKSCADCHGEAAHSMRGVAARHPAYDAAAGALVNLEQRINLCRTQRQLAPALAQEGNELLALAAFVGRQSRGLPIEVTVDEKTKPFLEAGRALFHRRQGQLNLACAQCHDGHWGKQLGGNPIPQAHPTGYPIWRLEWQAMGSLQRRLRNCMTGIRAEPYAAESPEFVALEYFLMWRARGMKLETPAVRP